MGRRLSYIMQEGPCRTTGVNKGGRGSKDLMTMRGTFALATLSLMLAVPAMAQDRSVQVVNESGFTIVQFYASSEGAANWQEDMLAGQAVGSGETPTVNFNDGSGACTYSFRAVFDDGDEAIQDIDVCSVTAVTYN